MAVISITLVDFCFNKHVSTNVCESVVHSASCHLYWIPPGVCSFSPPPLPPYILYSDDCRSKQENTYLVRFAYDSAVLSLLMGAQDAHGASFDDFLSWCDKSYLDLNVNKSKE